MQVLWGTVWDLHCATSLTPVPVLLGWAHTWPWLPEAVCLGVAVLCPFLIAVHRVSRGSQVLEGCHLCTNERAALAAGPNPGESCSYGGMDSPQRKTPKQELMQQGCLMASAVWL